MLLLHAGPESVAEAAPNNAFGASLPIAAAAGLVEQPLPAPAAGSRRRRVWELPEHCHCPLVGVCLPLPVASRVARKVLGEAAPNIDYDVHVMPRADQPAASRRVARALAAAAGAGSGEAGLVSQSGNP